MARTGRPTKYDPQFHPRLAEAWAAAGKTELEIAAKLGVCEKTLNTWKTKHPAFLQALKAGKVEPDDRVERSLFERAIGYNNPNAVKIFMPQGAAEPVYAPYTEHHAPDVTACIFWLKNRRPEQWRDAQQREHSGPGGSPLFGGIERVIVKADQ